MVPGSKLNIVRAVNTPAPIRRCAIGISQLVEKTLSSPRGPLCCWTFKNPTPWNMNIQLALSRMSIGVGDEVYILPLASVVESFQVAPDMIKTIGGTGRVVEVRDEFMPVIDLERVFEVPRFDFEHVSNIMVVVEAEGARVALLVDELLGQQQVVVKNLEANYRKVQDVSGATIMGDGRVALILDTGSLVRRSRH